MNTEREKESEGGAKLLGEDLRRLFAVACGARCVYTPLKTIQLAD
jgi:hypothetical protein